MEKLFFKKIELWLVGLIVVLLILGAIAFGNVVVHTMKGGTKAGIIGEGALWISNIPTFLKKLDQAEYFKVGVSKHEGKSGFAFGYAAGSRPNAGYLLLSRYDGDDKRPYVELVDMNAQMVIHRWAPDTDAIFASARNESFYVDLVKDRHLARMILRHPYVTETGSIISKAGTPLFRIDACSKLEWLNDDHFYHHSLETDAEGYLWTASTIEPTQVEKVDKEGFLDDGIAKLSLDGTLLENKSLTEIFLENDMEYVIYGNGHYYYDPTHLNDVQPVHSDGLVWKKGDLFLSMRSPSMVALYRPSTGKIIWHQAGPWIHQHDVDILDDRRIAIYDNNAGEFYRHRGTFGTVEVLIYDFETGEITSPWKDALAKHNVLAETEGLYRIFPDGSLFLEEQNHGRLMQVQQDGDLVWEYVNRAGDGRVYRVAWSRFFTNEEAAPFVAAIGKANCG